MIYNTSKAIEVLYRDVVGYQVESCLLKSETEFQDEYTTA